MQQMVRKAKEEKEEKLVSVKFTHADLNKLRKKWSYASNSVDVVEAEHIIQFLKPEERIHFVNELHRVLKKGGKAHILTPYWSSARAYGDLMFEMPPVSEAWLYHLNAEWRKNNAPWGDKYTCDFDPTWGYGMHPLIMSRNQEYQQHALTFWKEAAQDLVATLIKR